MFVAGLDVGSMTTKAVILGCGQLHFDVYSDSIKPTGIDVVEVSKKVVEEALEKINLTFNDVKVIVSTGYGRISIPFSTQTITEITCNAAGVNRLYPGATLAVDIGGQDSKVIRTDGKGRVIKFAMNDKCAAGTGKFLEIAAETLGVSLDELGEISLNSKRRITMSSICTVFAQTEIVSLIARRTAKEDIAAALHESVANRVFGLISSVNPEPTAKVVMTGGVARNIAIVKLLERMLGRGILVPDNPQMVTALGAAHLAQNIC
jgi:(R)-2-hydroxyacyl-CoA dehydratese activating ATPase